MSLLGFDAIGHWALGHPRDSKYITLAASAGSFAISAGGAATFTITEASAAGSFSIGAVAGSFTVKESAAAGAFAYTGVAASFAISEQTAAGAFTINGQPANEIILEADAPAAFLISTVPARLERTGFDYDFQQGGIGHLRLAAAEAARLAAITKRGPPGFVDLRSRPRFAPFGGPQVAAPAPVTNLPDIANQRATVEMQAAQAARKRRREAEAILLLAS